MGIEQLFLYIQVQIHVKNSYNLDLKGTGRASHMLLSVACETPWWMPYFNYMLLIFMRHAIYRFEKVMYSCDIP